MHQNAVTNWKGEIIGYKCDTCLKVYDSMWANVCNSCRNEERKHKEIVAALRSQNKTCSCACHKKDIQDGK